MLEGCKLLGEIGVGVTRPLLVQATDGNAYVVKTQNNRLGTKVLVNEYIALAFSRMMDLCFPPGDVIHFSADFIRSVRRLRQLRVQPGLHFATRYICHARYIRPSHIKAIKNKSRIAGVMLFDHLLHNADRTLNSKNMILQKETDGYVFYAIDNSHLFGSGRWQAGRLEALTDKVKINRRRLYGALLRRYLRAEDLLPYSAAFKAITPQQMTALVAGIPTEWLPQLEDREALLRFFLRRLQYVDCVTARIAASIWRHP